MNFLLSSLFCLPCGLCLMSVYTSVSEAQMRVFLQQYDLGEFISLKGIAQGVTTPIILSPPPKANMS